MGGSRESPASTAADRRGIIERAMRSDRSAVADEHPFDVEEGEK
jgi:hypothetical protein